MESRNFLVPLLVVGLLLESALAAEPKAALWNQLLPQLQQTLDLQRRQQQLPDHAWLGPDKASNQADINQLLDRAVTLLSATPGQHYRQRIRNLEAAIRHDQDVIADARQHRVGAPRQALWQQTQADYDAAIEAARGRIRQHRDEIQQVKHQFAADLQASGLQLSERQLDFLLSTVIGGRLIDLGVAFDNVRSVLHQLEDLLVASGENLDAAQRYYGMYVVLLEVLLKMHQDVLTTVAHYQDRLRAIEQRSSALSAESRQLLQTDQRHQAVLEANIAAQQLTLKSARLYADYLRRQAANVDHSRQQLAQDLAVARNTYETVRVSGELVALMQSGQRLLDNLVALRMPTLFTFQNLELQHEFEKLTRRLQQDEGSRS